jgi:RNA polymerase nonessential primary-like sigma factor
MTTPSIPKLASSRGAPASDTVQAQSRAPLLHSVHRTLIAALRHDYFSNGRGHLQSKPISPAKAPKATKAPKAPRALEAAASDAGASLDEPASLHAADGSPFDAAADAPPLAGDESAGADIVTRYLADVAKRQRLNSSEEYHLARQASEGHLEARQQLVEHHLGLVVMMAKRYLSSGMPLLDLIEEGNLGLIAASTKFDPELGHRFSTYAKWWIRQSIEMALMTQLRLVRLPIHLSRSIKQAARKQRLEQPAAAGAEGAPAGVSADMVALLDNDDRDAGTLIDELPAENDDSPDALLSLDQRRLQLQRVMAELNAKEQRVIQARFGLQQGEPRTLDDIARELGLSCERIRQIEKEALQKLRGLFSDQGIDLEAVL